MTTIRARICTVFLLIFLTVPGLAQQANVNLDWDPRRNADGLVPFSASLNSPEVHADRTVSSWTTSSPGNWRSRW